MMAEPLMSPETSSSSLQPILPKPNPKLQSRMPKESRADQSKYPDPGQEKQVQEQPQPHQQQPSRGSTTQNSLPHPKMIHFHEATYQMSPLEDTSQQLPLYQEQTSRPLTHHQHTSSALSPHRSQSHQPSPQLLEVPKPRFKSTGHYIENELKPTSSIAYPYPNNHNAELHPTLQSSYSPITRPATPFPSLPPFSSPMAASPNPYPFYNPYAMNISPLAVPYYAPHPVHPHPVYPHPEHPQPGHPHPLHPHQGHPNPGFPHPGHPQPPYYPPHYPQLFHPQQHLHHFNKKASYPTYDSHWGMDPLYRSLQASSYPDPNKYHDNFPPKSCYGRDMSHSSNSYGRQHIHHPMGELTTDPRRLMKERMTDPRHLMEELTTNPHHLMEELTTYPRHPMSESGPEYQPLTEAFTHQHSSINPYGSYRDQSAREASLSTAASISTATIRNPERPPWPEVGETTRNLTNNNDQENHNNHTHINNGMLPSTPPTSPWPVVEATIMHLNNNNDQENHNNNRNSHNDNNHYSNDSENNGDNSSLRPSAILQERDHPRALDSSIYPIPVIAQNTSSVTRSIP